MADGVGEALNCLSHQGVAMKILSAVPLLAALAACAGVAEMRADDPFASFVSAKAPDEVAACTAEAWMVQDRFPFTPDVRILPMTDGKQVMIYNSHSMAPDAFADITADGAGSKVAFYSKNRKVFKQTFADLTQGCL